MVGLRVERRPEDRQQAVPSELVHEAVLLHDDGGHASEVLVENLEQPGRRERLGDSVKLRMSAKSTVRVTSCRQLASSLDGGLRELRVTY
jgi:hypothetical protein